MFGDTISMTFDGASITLTKINQDNYSSEYLKRDSEESFRLRIRHTSSSKAGAEKRDRHNVELVHTVYADGDVPEREDKAYFVMDQVQSEPSVELMACLATWATASTNTALTKLTNWES